MREEKTTTVASYLMSLESIEARMDAEKRLNEDPQAFVMEQGRKKELCV